jgi:hypothetical protein
MMGVFLHHGFFAATLNRRTPNKRDQNRGRKLRRKNNHMENPGTKEVIFVDLGVTCASVFFFLLLLIFIWVLHLTTPSRGIYATKLSEYLVNTQQYTTYEMPNVLKEHMR